MKTIPLIFLFHMTNGKKADKLIKKQPEIEFTEGIGAMPNEEFVHLGSTFYDNNIDPSTGLKAPVDFLEMRMIYPETEEEKRYYLKNTPLADIQFYRTPLRSPFIYNPRENINETRLENMPLSFDFEALQSRNFDQQAAYPPKLPKLENPKKPTSVEFKEAMLVSQNSFSPGEIKINWTTCDEFKKKAVFHPSDLLNIDWIPFYVWSLEDYGEAMVHKFSVPTIKAVTEFKTEYAPYLSENVDWNQPKLLLEVNERMLLIAADQRGLFHGIKDQKISDYVKTHPEVKYPVATLRMKIVDPYLALMDCNEYYAQIMAIKGQEPETNDLKAEEAKILNFTGKGHPVSINLEREHEMAEWKKQKKINEEMPKSIEIKDEDYVGHKDHDLERW